MRLPILAIVLAVASCVTGHSTPRRRRGLPPESAHRLRRDATETSVPIPSAEGSEGVSEVVVQSVSANSEATSAVNVPVSSASVRPTSVTLPEAPSVAPTAAPSPTPTPLDTSINYALSESCLTYLSNLISTSTFKSCLPFSLIISGSSGYQKQVSSVTLSGNYSWINELVAYTSSPQPSVQECEVAFQGYYNDMKDKGNCASDLNTASVVKQARRGLGNYAVMRHLSSLINPSTGVYCYVEAIASSKPDDQYLWNLPAGNILPTSSTPTCSQCSKLFMDTIGAWAANTTTLNTTLINTAVTTINSRCGANFINYTPVNTNDASPLAAAPHVGLFLVFFSFLSWALL